MKERPCGSAKPARRMYLRRAAWLALLLGLLSVAALAALPFVRLPQSLFTDPVSQVEFVDRHGVPLRTVRADDNPFGASVSYGEIPQLLIHATLAAEDRRFWTHHGVDWRATLRAAWQLVSHRRILSGGSTITQQLIKLAEPRPRTLRTKVIEAVQALRLEQTWGKQQILAAYLNRLDYGNFNRSCAEAARFYFAKPLADLSPAECALLASIPQAPSRLNPHLHPERLRKRLHWVIGQMRQAGWLTDDQYRRALAEPVVLAGRARAFEAPHFVDLLLTTQADGWPSNEKDQLGKYLLKGIERNVRNGSTLAKPVRTTLDLDLNRSAALLLNQHLAQLQGEHVSNGAIVVLDNLSGGVLALVGSENYFSPAAGQVNGAWAPRSTGSALKPFTYLLAFERGATPATIVADVPTEFATATGLFAPVNYNRHCYGPMRYRLALANSLNISAVKVLASIGGPAPLHRLLQTCGLSTLARPAEDYGLGLTIGNAESRLLELANAYSCLARLGIYKPYRLLLDSRPAGSASLGRRVADPGAAYLIADILSDNDARLLSFGVESPLRFEFPVACKTGTSSDFRDNWAFGYTPEFTVGVWVGNFDGSPMQTVSGVTGAAPILHDVIELLHQQYGTSWYAMPTNVVEASIHPVSGQRLDPDSLSPRFAVLKEKFLTANLPPFEMPEPNSGPANSVRLGAEYRDWIASSDNWLGDRAVLAPAEDSLRIVFPPPGTTVYLDPDLPQHGSRMRLRAVGPPNLEWQSDSMQINPQIGGQVALLTEGRHRITARDPLSGARAETWINVIAR